jgi:hypothetical protein
MKCHSCEILSINGVICHERGCPETVYSVDCFGCGYEFESGSRTRGQLCPDCMHPQGFDPPGYPNNTEHKLC